jgi:hypothetical protein
MVALIVFSHVSLCSGGGIRRLSPERRDATLTFVLGLVEDQ